MSEPKVLCVDSDSRTCEWVRKVLTEAAITRSVTTIPTGQEAIRTLKREPHDIVVTEYALPDMTGVELCFSVREQAPEVPIMFFSALNRPVDRELAITAGADEYLVKPNDLDIFVDTVNHLLRLRQTDSPPYFLASISHTA
jgi:two-component system, OmpR family, response regulator PrrA